MRPVPSRVTWSAANRAFFEARLSPLRATRCFEPRARSSYRDGAAAARGGSSKRTFDPRSFRGRRRFRGPPNNGRRAHSPSDADPHHTMRGSGGSGPRPAFDNPPSAQRSVPALAGRSMSSVYSSAQHEHRRTGVDRFVRGGLVASEEKEHPRWQREEEEALYAPCTTCVSRSVMRFANVDGSSGRPPSTSTA